MATATSGARIKADYDQIFFQALAALVIVVVFVDFAQTFYLSGVLRCSLISATASAGIPARTNA